jgi:hypothetical protein
MVLRRVILTGQQFVLRSSEKACTTSCGPRSSALSAAVGRLPWGIVIKP